MKSPVHALEREATLVRGVARPATTAQDFDALLALADDAQFVLLGEASHGTHDFYALRAELTRRLITEKGFRAVALEADWPDSFRVHRYVTGRGDDQDATQALEGFRRFPTWMWRNTVVVEFVEWLRRWNQDHAAVPVGFYGMDLYSLHGSIEAVLGYLDRADPAAAKRARTRYGCFEGFAKEPQTYGLATEKWGEEPCEDEVVSQLVELRRRETELQSLDGHAAQQEEFFSAEQNARLIVNAEQYYRSMFRGRDESWNRRDTHMFETLCELLDHVDGGQADAKVVVWAHNSHLGNAAATEMGRQRGELNVGQLVRERFGRKALLVGFSTYSGTVTAASDWGEQAERKRVRPGMKGSYEELFHAVSQERFWLNLREANEATAALAKERLQRAIGVIYRPDTERWSHYLHACLPEQFDALIHLDETRALEPQERSSEWDSGELPETYPSAL